MNTQIPEHLSPAQKSLAAAFLVTHRLRYDVDAIIAVCSRMPDDAATKACHNLGWPTVTYEREQEMDVADGIHSAQVIVGVTTTLVLYDHTAQILRTKIAEDAPEEWLDSHCTCGWESSDYYDDNSAGYEHIRDETNAHLKAVFTKDDDDDDDD